jgi:hypothetical protein
MRRLAPSAARSTNVFLGATENSNDLRPILFAKAPFSERPIIERKQGKRTTAVIVAID